MVRDKDIVAIFHSVHRVMKAEKVLKLAGADFLLIPAPRQLASDCGLAIRYMRQARERIETLLDSEGLQPAELYLREGKGYTRLWP